MREDLGIEVRIKPHVVETPSDEELDLLVSVLPHLIALMQQFDEAED